MLPRILPNLPVTHPAITNRNPRSSKIRQPHRRATPTRVRRQTRRGHVEVPGDPEEEQVGGEFSAFYCGWGGPGWGREVEEAEAVGGVDEAD